MRSIMCACTRCLVAVLIDALLAPIAVAISFALCSGGSQISSQPIIRPIIRLAPSSSKRMPQACR